MKNAMLGTILAVVIFAFIFGCFLLGRYINYKFAYANMVVDEITNMVRPECLKK